MTDLRKAANTALYALEFNYPLIEDYGNKEQLDIHHEAIMALYKSLAQPEPIQVRPAEFAATVSAGVGADFVGTPMIWAEWPNPKPSIVRWSIPVDPNNFGEPLAQPEQNWSLLKATQDSLRQHMSRVKELEAQLAQTEQEPVAWMMPDYGDVLSASEADGTGIYNVPLYTAPPRKEWVGLTDEDAANICMQGDLNDWHDEQVIDAVESRLKEKNGG